MKKCLFFLFCCFFLLFSGCGGSSEAADEQVLEYGVVSSAEGNEPAEVTQYSVHSDGTAAKTETEAQVVEDGMNYFTFRTSTQMYQNENGQDLLRQVLTDPDFYSPDTGLYDWVNGVLDGISQSEHQIGQELLNYATQEQKSQGEDFYSFSHYLTMGIGRHDNHIASVLMLSSMYSGGPYPSTVQTAKNLDLKALSVLTLEDILQENTEQTVYEMVLEGVQEKFALVGEGGLYEDYEKTIRNALTFGNMTSHWYFNDVGLVIFFNQYELASLAAGIVKIELSYDSLDGILKPEYIPEPVTGYAEEAVASKTAPQSGEICYVSFGEGDTVYLSLIGQAFHVQLSEVFFAEGTPVGESMLFSANFVEDGTVFAVQGDWSDNETVYGIQYSDQFDDSYVLYMTSAEVWDKLPK